jgi:hypothetical protein
MRAVATRLSRLKFLPTLIDSERVASLTSLADSLLTTSFSYTFFANCPSASANTGISDAPISFARLRVSDSPGVPGLSLSAPEAVSDECCCPDGAAESGVGAPADPTKLGVAVEAVAAAAFVTTCGRTDCTIKKMLQQTHQLNLLIKMYS